MAVRRAPLSEDVESHRFFSQSERAADNPFGGQGGSDGNNSRHIVDMCRG
jgi:hypothetical protein